MNEIEKLKECFAEQFLPIQIYLFGSFANNTYTSESDLENKTTSDRYSFRNKKRFEERKEIPSVENEVYRKGVLC